MYITFKIEGSVYSKTDNRLMLTNDLTAWAKAHNTHCWIYAGGLRNGIVEVWFEKPRDYTIFAFTWTSEHEWAKEFTIVEESPKRYLQD